MRPEPIDLTLISSDATIFFVHIAALLAKSSNGFGSLLRPECLRLYATNPRKPLAVANAATVLNLVLHVVYDLSHLPHNLGLRDLITAVDALAFYGVSLQDHARHGTPLFQLLASHMVAAPIDVYALAASHDLQDMAVLGSAYSLGKRASDITNDQAVRMGVHYLRRLIDLQLSRASKLKGLLRNPPARHPPTENCSIATQEQLAKAWLIVGAYFLWETVPGVCLLGCSLALLALTCRSN